VRMVGLVSRSTEQQGGDARTAAPACEYERAGPGSTYDGDEGGIALIRRQCEDGFQQLEERLQNLLPVPS
jgi:hypothetical protein